MVYVISKNGKALMPTKRYGKVRHLLKEGLAKKVKSNPFTIQLLYDSKEFTQEVSLGIDAGSKHMGVSATTEDEVLYEADITLRNDITDLMSARRESRKFRRYRKTRYRQARFSNRVRSKHKGWLAPGIEEKVNTHLTVTDRIMSFLPVTKITVETASFDTQLLKALENDMSPPEGTDYQQGEQLGFWNVREYVLFRDGHTCRCCKGKSKDRILEVHHIESRKTGGNAPNNLVTLCQTCHKDYHDGKITLPESIKRGNKYNDAAFMGIMRFEVYKRLKERYPDTEIHMTYGYITKNTRIENGLPKEHCTDARCISGNPKAVSDGSIYFQKKIRCHNRQIHKLNILKGGIRKNNQAPFEVKGFRLFDKVKYNGEECFIYGRRSSGYFDIRKLDGEKVHAGIRYDKLKLLEHPTGYLTERRWTAFPLMTEVTSIHAEIQ